MKPADAQGDAEFFWNSDPEFDLSTHDGGVGACVAHELTQTTAGNLESLLTSYLETALSVTRANAGVIRVLQPDEQTLQVISSIGVKPEELEPEHLADFACESCPQSAFKRGLCTTSIHGCETHAHADISNQFLSILSIPLEGKNMPGAPLGVFTLLFDTPKSTSSNEATKALAFADLLGTLIEHIQSSREAKRAELLMERQSIANEIHDSLAQTINYARMSTALLNDAVRKNNQVMSTKYVKDIDEALEIGQKAVRSLITDFRSEMDPAGLLHALQDLCDKFKQQYPIALNCSVRIADLDIPLEHEIQVYHVVQEALSNIAQHSSATHARIVVENKFGYYLFTIQDNGIGTFSPVEGHYGIIIMRERAQKIGGHIRVDSTKGVGTSVQLYFPEPEANWRILDDKQNKNRTG